jgi:glycosyltransferase involved in cell wall biosynthesis
VDVLIRAWRRLDHPDAHLCVVGDGPLLEKVRAHAPPSVRFTGRVERSRLPAAYAAASFVVVPSIVTRRFLEPWGLVCNEAMMQGRPVIASAAVGAVPGGLVHHGATGMVVRPGDAAELATAMGILLEDRALVERMRPVARAAAAELTYERAADAFGDALAAAGVR